jgi:hypothetical protein
LLRPRAVDEDLLLLAIKLSLAEIGGGMMAASSVWTP